LIIWFHRVIMNRSEGLIVKTVKFVGVVIAVLLMGAAAQAGPTGTFLLGIDFTNNNLVSIDPTSGVFTVVGTVTGGGGAGNFLGIANGPGGNVYGIDTINSELYQIPITGTVGAISNTFDINSNNAASNGFNEGDVTYNGSTGYVDNSLDGSSNGLFSFTNAGGTLTGPIGAVSSPTFDGLAFVSSTLYGLSAQGGTALYTINTTTGVATEVGTGTGINLGVGFNFGGLALLNGVLYGEVSGESGGANEAFLYTIDTGTGVASLVGEIEDANADPFTGGLSGIAGENISPEPGTVGLMFLGLAGIAAARRRLFKR
jgi:PEP-CTERM motif